MEVAAGVRRIVAPNPSVMTYHGTNTYLIDDPAGGITVLDPGPAEPAHVMAILRAGAGRIARILLSHSHADHAGATAELQASARVPLFAWLRHRDNRVSADEVLTDGDEIAGLRVLHTPGHAADHVCLAWRDGILFTADHVMGWASSIVSPPDGDMADYFKSLNHLLCRSDRQYLCGHGPAVDQPQEHVRQLLTHRVRREEALLNHLRDHPASEVELMDRLYSKLDPWLRRAATRNVLAHLLKLEAEGQVEQDGLSWRATRRA